MKCCHKHAEKNELGNYERYLRSQEKKQCRDYQALHDDRKYGRVSTAAGVGAGGRWTPVDVNRQRDKTDCVEYGRHNPYYVVEC